MGTGEWIVKHITHREIRDLHRDIADVVNNLNPCESVLDIAPPHVLDMSTIIDAEYVSMGLTGKRVHIKHNLNVYPYPVHDNRFDVVIMSHIIEHLDNPFKALMEGYRIAKHYLIIAIPSKCRLSKNKLGHLWHWDIHYTYSRPNGKYMPKFLRKWLATCFARSVMFVVKKR